MDEGVFMIVCVVVGRGSDQAEYAAPAHGLGTRTHVQFLVDVLDVGVDGLPRDAQLDADLLGDVAARHERRISHSRAVSVASRGGGSTDGGVRLSGRWLSRESSRRASRGVMAAPPLTTCSTACAKLWSHASFSR